MLYFTASQATLTAPFYTGFSQSLKAHSGDLFPVDPATSPAIFACTALATRILSYWLCVFLLVMSMMAIFYFGSGNADPKSPNLLLYVGPLIYTVVFVGGFFTFGFGGLVYLGFESDLRIAIDRSRLANLSTVQADYWKLFSRRDTLSAEEWVRLGRLKETSDFLAKPGYLGGSLRSVATLAVAILPPIVSTAGAIFTIFSKTGLKH